MSKIDVTRTVSISIELDENEAHGLYDLIQWGVGYDTVTYVEAGAGKHGYIDSLIANDDIGTEYDEDEVERRIVVG